MFLRRAISEMRKPTPKMAAIEGGDWNIVDIRTGRLLSGAQETDSGEPVSAEGALYYHAWYRAISLIAEKSAAVPKHLYRSVESNGREGKEKQKSHNVYSLINSRVNTEQTAFFFWLQMAGHLASRGNAFAWIDRDGVNGPPRELIPLDPDKTHPFRKDGKLWYVTYPFGHTGQGYKEPAENILHFKGWGFDGLVGYPVWEVAANEIALARGERKLTASRFKNSGRPSMILTSDRRLTERTLIRIREDWERMVTGLDNAGKTAVLHDGLKATPINMTAEELQQSGAAAMSLTAISNYTGVPVSKLGGQKSSQSQEQEDRGFINDGLDFWLNCLDDEATHKLLTESEVKQGYEIKSNREALLRPDTKTKFEIIRIATGGKPIITQNEGRDFIDLPPIDEDGADELGTPLNMGQGGFDNTNRDNAGEPPGRPEDDESKGRDEDSEEGEDMPEERRAAAQTPDRAALIEAARYALAFTTAKMVKRVGSQALSIKTSVKYCEFVDSLTSSHREVIRTEFLSVERLANVLDPHVKDGHISEWFMVRIQAEYGELVDTATEKTLAAKVQKLYHDQLARLPQDAADIFASPTTE